MSSAPRFGHDHPCTWCGAWPPSLRRTSSPRASRSAELIFGARCVGELKADLERSGTPLAEPDLRIAAIVLTAELTLVTRNVKHFARVPGLVVENWIDEA